MKKLRNKVYVTILFILTIFQIVFCLFFNVSIYKKEKDTLDNNIITPLTFMYSYTTNTKVYCREYSLSKLSKNRVYIFNKLDIKKECFYSDGIILSQIEDIKNTKRYWHYIIYMLLYTYRKIYEIYIFIYG